MSRYMDLLKQAGKDSKAKGRTRAEEILASGCPALPIARTRTTTKDERGMNGLESSYASRLEEMKAMGLISGWWWDALALKLGHDCRYHTDFLVQFPDGELQLHETKGHMEDDALVKLKACRAWLPFRIFLVKRETKASPWSITEIKPW